MVLLVVLLLLALVVVWYLWSHKRNRLKAAADEARYEKICDTVQTISSKVYISFEGFQRNEITNLKYFLVRGHRIIANTLVREAFQGKDNYYSGIIPFAIFKKTDTVVVQTSGADRRYFWVSGFRYRPYLYNGAMGYLGECDCRLFDGDYLVNGKKSYGALRKADGMRQNPLTPR